MIKDIKYLQKYRDVFVAARCYNGDRKQQGHIDDPKRRLKNELAVCLFISVRDSTKRIINSDGNMKLSLTHAVVVNVFQTTHNFGFADFTTLL